jgi:hypothetical protein
MSGDLFERPGNFRIAENFSGMWRAARRQKNFCGIGVMTQFSFAGEPVAGKDFRDGKTFFGITNGWSKQSGEFFASETAVKFVPAVNCARNSHSMNSVGGHNGDALGFQEFGCEAGRRPTAGVEAVEFAGFSLVDDGEEVAADAVCHRSENADGSVCGDGGINGIPAL